MALGVMEMALDLLEGVCAFQHKDFVLQKNQETRLISQPEVLILITGLYKSLTESCFLETVDLFLNR